eukprot:jgi/Botrbrau1/19629/Bobra.0513s0001.1
MDDSFVRKLGLNQNLMAALAQLPGTRGNMRTLRRRALALSDLQTRLSNGMLPDKDSPYDWPAEPFRSSFHKAVRNLEMPRFIRQNPAVGKTFLRQYIEFVHEFEAEMMAMEEEKAKQDEQKQQQKNKQQSSQGMKKTHSNNGETGGQQGEEGDEGGGGEEEGEGSGGQPQDSQDSDGNGASPSSLSAEAMEMRMKEMSGKNGSESNIEVGLQDLSSGGKPVQDIDKQKLKEYEEKIKQKTKELVEKFEEEWKPVAEALKEASEVFDNLEGEATTGLSRVLPRVLRWALSRPWSHLLPHPLSRLLAYVLP